MGFVSPPLVNFAYIPTNTAAFHVRKCYDKDLLENNITGAKYYTLIKEIGSQNRVGKPDKKTKG